MQMAKLDIAKLPDWIGTAMFSIVCSLVGFAFMWGSLKSEVSSQVTAQATNASDIKELIQGQSSLQATVMGLAEDQKQIHQDFLSLMRTRGTTQGQLR